MAYLRIYQDGLPPVLNDGRLDIQVDNYIVGSLDDPHWNLYPKSMFHMFRNSLQVNYAITDYEADANHYIYYIPEHTGPTLVYSRLLKNHFETINRNLQQPAREAREAEIAAARAAREAEIAAANAAKEERKEKVKQLNNILKGQLSQLKSHEDDLKTLGSDRARYVRRKVRSLGIPQEMVENIYDSKYPSYAKTEGSIAILKRNIVSLKNELRYYTD